VRHLLLTLLLMVAMMLMLLLLLLWPVVDSGRGLRRRWGKG
jgi:hypothetical protein